MLPGGAGTLVQGQRTAAGLPGGARRTRLSAPGPVHAGPPGHPETRRTASVLSGPRQRGKAGKVALAAVMHKLLLRLHAVARRGARWVLHPGQLSSIANPWTNMQAHT